MLVSTTALGSPGPVACLSKTASTSGESGTATKQDGKRRNGPAKVFGRVNPKGPYAHGMKAPAAAIRELGLTAGIWWMPFAGDRNDPFFADKQDWFVKKADGTPYFARWGGT